MSVAWLGTGLLGSGFVEHLLATGSGASVWNRTAAKAARFAADGARVAATPAEAVRGMARVHLCLRSDESVDAMWSSLTDDAIVLDHTTVSPAGAARRAARFAEAGRAFLHAPVFMSPQSARDAKGIMMVSGPEEVFARVDGALAALTGDLWYLGPEPTRAAAMKLVGNSMLIAIAAGLADTLALGKSAGLAPADVMAVMDRLKPGGAISIRGKRMADADFTATFELAMARKDVGLMLDCLGDAPLSILRGVAARADELLARGHAADDLGVLAIDAV